MSEWDRFFSCKSSKFLSFLLFFLSFFSYHSINELFACNVARLKGEF